MRLIQRHHGSMAISWAQGETIEMPLINLINVKLRYLASLQSACIEDKDKALGFEIAQQVGKRFDYTLVENNDHYQTLRDPKAERERYLRLLSILRTLGTILIKSVRHLKLVSIS